MNFTGIFKTIFGIAIIQIILGIASVFWKFEFMNSFTFQLVSNSVVIFFALSVFAFKQRYKTLLNLIVAAIAHYVLSFLVMLFLAGTVNSQGALALEFLLLCFVVPSAYLAGKFAQGCIYPQHNTFEPNSCQ